MNRRGVLIGGASLIASPALAFGLGKEGARRGFGGMGGVGKGASAAPFTPLAGSAVDMNFATSQYYPAPLASLMDGTLTSATGALLTALQSQACSILLYLKAAPTVPASWISATGGSQTFLVRGATDTTAVIRDALTPPNNLTATAGSGAFSTTASKVCSMFDSTTGRSIVMNNGTVATDTNFPSTTLQNVNFINVAAAFNRLTVYTNRLADATGKGLTV